MKKFAWTIAAFVAFVGLLGWTLTKERGRVPDKEEVFRGEIVRAEDITRLEIIRYEHKAVDADEPPEDPGTPLETLRTAMEKRDDEWHVTQPYEGLADPETAASMVKTIVELKPSVREDADLSAPEYGLENPLLEVVATLKTDRHVRITVGGDTPVGGKLFAKISDKQGLFLLPSSFRTDLDKDPDTLRDKKLARFDKADVMRVTFISPNGTIAAERRKQDAEKDMWQIVKPEQVKGSEWAITSAFGKLAETDVKEHLDAGDLNRYGLDRPRAFCRVELKDGRVIDVSIGKEIRRKLKVSEYSDTEEEKDLVYAMRRGRNEVLLVEKTLLDELSKDLMAFRDNRILDFARDQVLSMRIARRTGLNFTVMRAGDDWTIQSPTTGRASRTKVDDILWDLTDLEAREYVTPTPDLKQVGLAVPSTVITLRLRGNRNIQVKIGDEIKLAADSWYYCQTSESPQVYKVTDMLIKDLPETLEDLQEGDVPAPPMSFDDMDLHIE